MYCRFNKITLMERSLFIVVLCQAEALLYEKYLSLIHGSTVFNCPAGQSARP